MTDVTLHATPRERDVMREQVRFIALALRRETLVLAVVLALVTIRIVFAIVRHCAASWFDGDPSLAITIASFLFPFAVWRGQKRFGPAFLWTLPVDRGRLALARVFAGWVWLMAALVVVAAWRWGLALVAGLSPIMFTFAGATAMYLFGSAWILGLRHPLRWLIGATGGFLLLGNLVEALGRTPSGEWRIVTWSSALRWAVYGPYGLRTLLSSHGIFHAAENAAATWRTLPGFAQWITTTLSWLGAGLLALWLATLRHRERRRY